MWTRRRFLKSLGAGALMGLTPWLPGPGAPGMVWAADPVAEGDDELRFAGSGHTPFGDWWADVRLTPRSWFPGSNVQLEVFLHLSPGLIPALQAAGYSVDSIQMLATSERRFDPEGRLRLPLDERMSTLLTPAGLAIEGGSVAAVSRTTGSRYRNPVDRLVRRPVGELLTSEHSRWTRFLLQFPLPADTPPGIYRLRLDFGMVSTRRSLSLTGDGFGNRPREPTDSSLLFSPPIRCSGPDASGRQVDAGQITPRLYWILLGQYNSNGYQGVVADEDSGTFALSDRNLIPDQVILPLYDARGVNKVAYNLEPDFITDFVDEQRRIPWNYSSGEVSIQVTDPSGKTTDLGTAAYTGRKGRSPTTGNRAFTQWRPQAYGRYTVVARGWILDEWGNRYEGGGSYHFWIAKRMTMATATFQGMPYPVGSRYGRDIGFAPAVPADVTVEVDLYPNSEAAAVRSLTYGGKATAGGTFGAAQGMKPFILDAPGEYHARILATYTDPEGHLWVCVMRHAGVVYPPDSDLIAHGKKVKVGNQLLDRGETRFEGYIEPGDGFRHLDHLNFPYHAGDVLLIASEGQGANKIEPVMTYEVKGSGQAYDPRLQPIGNTNVRIETATGLSPHLYPEHIKDLAYYYGAGPRPGLMSRFLVGEDGVRAPYWPTSATSFGGQIGATNNGDMPGTIYRLLGAVVLRPRDGAPRYAGYIASSFILPGGSNNNRVIAPGAEDLLGADGEKFRFFLVSLRPGMVYEQGATFVPAFQIDPMLPARIRFRLRFPDGSERTAEGTGDAFGSCALAPGWPLEQPGLHLYNVESEWEGNPGHVPGLPAEGGQVYVIEKARPEGAAGLKLNLKNQQPFSPDEGLVIEGRSTASTVHFAAVTPGCVVDQGSLPVEGGVFRYRFDPAAVAERVPLYDVRNRRNGRKELGRVIHLTFFAAETAPDGTLYHAFARVLLRGATAICTA